jgi:hypothetical protein
MVGGSALLLVTALTALTALTGVASDGTDGGAEDAPVVGRFSVVSAAGGAVWAFQPGGGLFVVGPGDLTAEGGWTPEGEHGQFDADLYVAITGQELTILGAVAPDGEQVALYVAASEATAPLDGTPWPSVSRLVGERVGMEPTETPNPTPVPDDCLRPTWTAADTVEWERCRDGVVAPSSEPSPAPEV